MCSQSSSEHVPKCVRDGLRKEVRKGALTYEMTKSINGPLRVTPNNGTYENPKIQKQTIVNNRCLRFTPQIGNLYFRDFENMHHSNFELSGN